MPDGILEITEEKIFKTLGRGRVPLCDLLNQVDIGEFKSIRIIEQTMSQIAPEQISTISSLQNIRDSHIKNLSDLKVIKQDMGCK